MKNIFKEKRAKALKQVMPFINSKTLREYLSSPYEYFIDYQTSGYRMPPNILSKLIKLAHLRKEVGVEFSGVLFNQNNKVTFIFYINDNPQDAWYESNTFQNMADFEKELERQSNELFVPDKAKEGYKMFYKQGSEIAIYLKDE